MDNIDRCTILENTTYFVTVFEGDEPLIPETTISSGSAVSISENGHLLTAAHVVTGRLPIQKKDFEDPEVIMVGRKKGGDFIQYIPGKCGLELMNPYFKKPLTIDLAILHPRSPQKDVPFLSIGENSVEVGTQVLMAGYPDDMELPFQLDQLLNKGDPSVQKIHRRLQLSNQPLMIKSGMIGNQNGFVLTDGKLTVRGEIIYIDNELHSGASGGPVVNMSMEIIGIITQRAITSISTEDLPYLKVPSGSTVAVSPRAVQSWITDLP